MDTYDEQIETILNKDYEAYFKCFSNDGYGLLLCELDDTEDVNDMEIWADALNHDGSIFSMLPTCNYCASQIETYNYPGDLVDKLLKDKTCSLKDIPPIDTNFEDDASEFRFSREQLEEFARRQRLAKELVRDKNEKIIQ